MSYSKMGYYRVIASLVGIILLLILFIVIIPPKVEIKEVEVEKEVIVEVVKEPTYKYNITSAEREMLARLVYREANIESLECQMAVISVVINRWQDGRWGDSLEDVIYSPYQFTPANLLYKTTPTELNYTAVDLVLQNGCTLPPYVMFFRADYHFNWDGYKPYAQIDCTCFGYLEVDKNEG
jgi:hypothetical protein